jgi:hypothetical protein
VPYESKNSLYTDNYATSGGAIYVDSSTTLNIYDVTYRGNGAIEEGGVLKMTNEATLYMEGSIVEYNWSNS